MNKLTEAQKGYIAGILDGEGSLMLHISKTGMIHSRINIGQKDKRLIDWLMETTGVGTTGKPFDLSRKRNSNVHGTGLFHKWHVNRSWEIVPLLRAVLPYLVLKKRKAMVLILVAKTVDPNWQRRPVGHKSPAIKVLQFRNKCLRTFRKIEEDSPEYIVGS